MKLGGLPGDAMNGLSNFKVTGCLVCFRVTPKAE